MLGMEMMLKQMLGISTEEMAEMLANGKAQLSALVAAMAGIEKNTAEALAIVQRIEERQINGNGNHGLADASVGDDNRGGSPRLAIGSTGGGTDGSDNG